MNSSLPSNNPLLAFNEVDLDLPGIRYGEFDLTAIEGESAPFKASLFSVAIGTKTPIDEHSVRECWHIIAGTGTLNYNGEEHIVSAPQLLFFESHHPHFIHNTGNEELKILSIWWPRLDGLTASEVDN